MRFNCRETYIKADVSESPNDRNDRAIRVAAAWYMRRVPGMPIIVLTNDTENRRKALEMGINAMSVQVGAILAQHIPQTAYLILSARKFNITGLRPSSFTQM